MIVNITEAGTIRLNDKDMPGIVQSISVSGKVVYESKEQSGKTNRVKVINGFDDADVSINVALVDDINPDTNDVIKSDYDCLAELNAAFRKLQNGIPVIYNIKHKHLNARGVKKVLFSELSSSEGIANLSCSLKFIETDSLQAKIQAQQNNQTAANTGTQNNPPKILTKKEEEAIKKAVPK